MFARLMRASQVLQRQFAATINEMPFRGRLSIAIRVLMGRMEFPEGREERPQATGYRPETTGYRPEGGQRAHAE
jgi:hypothetical protein